MIHGWPEPTESQIKLFQQNNGLTVDGIYGPKSEAAAWREEGTARYTHLAGHRVTRGGAEKTRAYVAQYVIQNPMPLEGHAMFTLAEIISSGWKTGLDYLSTQDGITFGMRRLAASTAGRFFDLPIKDAPNNGWPLCDKAQRAYFLTAAADRCVWARQMKEFVEFIEKQLDRNPGLRKGRTIALLCRAANSAGGLVKGLPAHDGEAYRELKHRYSKRSAGPRRIEQIEDLVGERETWR